MSKEIISFLDKIIFDYIAGEKTRNSNAKERFNEAEGLKEKITGKKSDEVIVKKINKKASSH